MNKRQIVSLLVASMAYLCLVFITDKSLLSNPLISLFRILFYSFSAVILSLGLESLNKISFRKALLGKLINITIFIVLSLIIVLLIIYKPTPYNIPIFLYLTMWLSSLLMIHIIDCLKKNKLQYWLRFFSITAFAFFSISILQTQIYKIANPSKLGFQEYLFPDGLTVNDFIRTSIQVKNLEQVLFSGFIFIAVTFILLILINAILENRLVKQIWPIISKLIERIQELKMVYKTKPSIILSMIIISLLLSPLVPLFQDEYPFLILFLAIIVSILAGLFINAVYLAFVMFARFWLRNMLFAKTYFEIMLLFNMVFMFLFEHSLNSDASIHNAALISSNLFGYFYLSIHISFAVNFILMFLFLSMVVLVLIQSFKLHSKLHNQKKKNSSTNYFVQFVLLLFLLFVDFYLFFIFNA